MSQDQEWRWADPQGQQRQIRLDELRAALSNGAVPPNAPVWRRGWTEWRVASEVPELMSSALSASNGVLPNIPPPPLFVVAAQAEFERKAPATAGATGEPPAPPRYVPSAVKAAPMGPSSVRSVGSGASSRMPLALAPSRPAAAAPAGAAAVSSAVASAHARAVPRKTMVGVAPPTNVVAPPATATEALRRATPLVDALPRDVREEDTAVGDVASLATVVGRPAIDDPRLAAQPAAARPAAGSPAAAPYKRQTLVLFGGAPSPAPEDKAPGSVGQSAPPIVVPSPAAAAPGRNIVTKPPPWGDGAVGMSPHIPPSSAPPRPVEPPEEISASVLIEADDEGIHGIQQLTPSRPPAMPSRSVPPPAVFSPVTAPFGPAPPAPAPEPPHVDDGATVAEQRSMPTLPPSGPPPRDGGLDPDAIDRISGRHAATGDGDALTAAPFPQLAPLFERFPALRRMQRGKGRFFLPVVGGLTAFVALFTVALVVKGCTSLFGSRDDATAGPAGSASAPGTGRAAPLASTTPPVVPALSAAPSVSDALPACTVAGQARTIAPRALVPSGVEVQPTTAGFAVGFATAPKEGVVLELDPASLATVAQRKVHGAEPLRRVTPVEDGAKVAAVGDVDRQTDKLGGRRVSPGPRSVDVGLADGSLAWAPHGTDKITALWPLPGADPVEALRLAPLTGGGGYAVAFRRAGAIWLGVLGGDRAGLSAKGELSGVAGLGPQVGSPALATSGNTVLVVWADRASTSDPWGLRIQRWNIGEAPEAARAFVPPAGGLGAPFMSPGVAGLGDGRFLVVWTEGPVSSHQVRAQTLDASGMPVGPALAVSAEGANAGQGQVAVKGGKGVVAYLAGGGTKFEVVATPLTCPAP